MSIKQQLHADAAPFTPTARTGSSAGNVRNNWGSAAGSKPPPAYGQQPGGYGGGMGYPSYYPPHPHQPHPHHHHHHHHQHQHHHHHHHQHQHQHHHHHHHQHQHQHQHPQYQQYPHHQHHQQQQQSQYRHPAQHTQQYEQQVAAHYPSHPPSHTSNTGLHHSENGYVPPGKRAAMQRTQPPPAAAQPRPPQQQHVQPTQQLANSVPAPAAPAPAQQPVPPANQAAPSAAAPVEPAADAQPAKKKWVARGKSVAIPEDQKKTMEEMNRKKQEAEAEEQKKKEREAREREEARKKAIDALVANEEEERSVIDMNVDHEFELLENDETKEKAEAQQRYEERLKKEEAERKEAEREAREYDILKWDRVEGAELLVEWKGTVLKAVLNDGEGHKNGMQAVIGKTLASCNGKSVENEDDIAAAIESDPARIVFKFRKATAADGLVAPDLSVLRDQLKRMKMDNLMEGILSKVETTSLDEVEPFYRLLQKCKKDNATIAAKSLLEMGFDDSILRNTVTRRITIPTTCYLCSAVGFINEMKQDAVLARLKAVLGIEDSEIDVNEEEYRKALGEVTEKERKEGEEKQKKAEEEAERVSKKQVDTEAKVEKVEKDDTRDALKKEFLLETAWQLFFTQAPVGDEKWKEPVSLAKVSEVRELWNVLAHLPLPHTLKENSSYALFRNDIEPTWEHEANLGGGQWRATLEYSKDNIDRCWVQLIMKLAGENFAKSHSLINGVTFERKWGENWRMNLWLRAGDSKLYPALGREFKEVAVNTKTLKGDKVKFIETSENKSAGTKMATSMV